MPAHLSRAGAGCAVSCCLRRWMDSVPSAMPTARLLPVGAAASASTGTGYLCTVVGRYVSASKA